MNCWRKRWAQVGRCGGYDFCKLPKSRVQLALNGNLSFLSRIMLTFRVKSLIHTSKHPRDANLAGDRWTVREGSGELTVACAAADEACCAMFVGPSAVKL
eukprot:scaffold603897_cov14-Prasinocladus_malaysianus.AAC.1